MPLIYFYFYFVYVKDIMLHFLMLNFLFHQFPQSQKIQFFMLVNILVLVHPHLFLWNFMNLLMNSFHLFHGYFSKIIIVFYLCYLFCKKILYKIFTYDVNNFVDWAIKGSRLSEFDLVGLYPFLSFYLFLNYLNFAFKFKYHYLTYLGFLFS